MKLRVSVLPLLLCAALFHAGCSTIDSRIRSKQAAFDSAPAEQQQRARQGLITLGATPDLVHIAVGRPDRISVLRTAAGVSEVWTYYEISRSRTYYASGYFSSRHRGYYPTSFDRDWTFGPPLYSPTFSEHWSPGFDYPYSSSRSTKVSLRVTFRDGKVVSYEDHFPK